MEAIQMGFSHWQPHQWVLAVYTLVGMIAAVTDYTRGKIYNWLTLPAMLFALIWAGLQGWEPLLAAFGGILAAAIVFVPLYAIGAMGGGDVKLMFAFGAFLGADEVLHLTFWSIIVAAAGGVVLLFYHRRVGAFFRELKLCLQSIITPGLAFYPPKLNKDIKAPFGIAIFVAFVILRFGA